MEEAGPEKSFELSPTAFAQRWRAGLADMRYPERLSASGEVIVVRRPAAS
jgi:NTE family protein